MKVSTALRTDGAKALGSSAARMLPIGETGKYINGVAFKPTDWSDEGLPIVRIQNLTDRTKPMNRTMRIVDPAYVVQPGDLLVSWSATLDAFVWDREPALLNQHIFKVVPNTELVSKKYLFFALRQAIVEMGRTEHLHGSTMKHINRGPFLAHRVRVPPLREQAEIVAELEKQFSRLDEAVANLKRVKSNLRNLRASALNAACEGPWPRVEFGSLARETLVGLDRGRDQQRSVGPGHRYVKMNNVTMDGKIESEGIVYVDATGQEAARFALRPGDILFNTRNSVELVGKSALVPQALDGALYNNNLMRIRTTSEIDSAFLAMQMCAPAFRRELEKAKRATTSVAAIYLKDLVRLHVIVPPIAEQDRIVAEVDRRLSIVREVQAEVDANLKRASALQQTILSRAFRQNALREVG
jgi:type I restriction enzyme S subunit